MQTKIGFTGRGDLFMVFKNVYEEGACYKDDVLSLYDIAFPEEEKKPVGYIEKLVSENKMSVYAILEENEFAGLVITLTDKKSTILDFFAICPDKRGKGLGGKALKILKEKYKDKPFILEIETIDENADNIRERIRRKNFYLRNGMKETGVIVNMYQVDYELLSFDGKLSFEIYDELMKNIHGDEIKHHLKQVS